jgi:GTP-binding protein
VFVDRIKIGVVAGNGGRGCVAFRREKHVPRGGPSGGDGGKGGDVVFEIDEHMTTLLDFYYIRMFKTKNGKIGGGSNKTGASGDDCVIRIPPGTTIMDAGTGDVVADLVNGRFVVAKGGKGGKGNAGFATSFDRAPRRATEGESGEIKNLILELKLIADVGLVGAPNAGKSTLLSRVSKAKPKIAPYPFTTLEPNLGIVELDTSRRLVFCDIPGLIEDAHIGKGLGLEFLRHVERNLLLLILIDLSNDPKRDLKMILKELQKYADGLLANKPYIVVGTKLDVVQDESWRKEFDCDIRVISSVTGEGLKELLEDVFKKISEIKGIVDG